MLSPLSGEPVLELIHGEKRTLVVADLHIGLEWGLQESGIHIPSGTAELANALLGCLKKSGAEELLFIGDLKHNVPRASGQEYRELPAFISEFTGRARVNVIPGNHDGGIKNVLGAEADVVIHPVSGIVMDGVGFLHGHTWPGEPLLRCGTIVCAHNHPKVRLTDEVGHAVTERVWLRSPLAAQPLVERYPDLRVGDVPRELIVMPAFNPRCGGMVVNEEPVLIGPLFANGIADLERTRVYMLDGTYLGEVRALREDAGSKAFSKGSGRGRGWKIGGKVKR